MSDPDNSDEYDDARINGLLKQMSEMASNHPKANVILAALGLVYNLLMDQPKPDHDRTCMLMHAFVDTFCEDFELAQKPLADVPSDPRH